MFPARAIWTATLLQFLPWALPLYLLRFKIGPFPTTGLEIYLIGLFTVFLCEGGRQAIREGWKNLGRFRTPIFAWVITTLIAVTVAPHSVSGLGLWRAYILEPILVFFIMCALQRHTLLGWQERGVNTYLLQKISIPISKILVQNLFLIVIVLTAWAVIQFIIGHGIPHPWDVSIAEGRRATGPFPYPNALALFVVPVGALALATRGIGRQGLGIITVVCAFLACLLARSDGGVIALGVATWLALFFSSSSFSIPHSRYTVSIRKLLIAATALVLLLIALIPKLHQPIIRELTFQNWSGKVRMYMWRDTRAMLKDHWFFGAGFGGYPTVFKPYQRTTGIEVFQYPHNIVLNFWSETGLLGLLSFIWIVMVWIRSHWTIHDSRFTIHVLPLLAILIHGLIDVPYFKNDLAILFWLLLWITTQSSNLSDQSSRMPAGLPSTKRA